jgi:hypothetical protein
MQHLFVGIVIWNTETYTRYIWPLNMVLLSVTSIAVFPRSIKRNLINTILLAIAIAGPFFLPFASDRAIFMSILSFFYVLLFAVMFWELMRFLVRPGYINTDIISAAVCGYLLMIEFSVFIFQTIYYNNPAALKGVDNSSSASIYMDIVYFCSITFTSIGFGDITPGVYYTKLLTSIFGIAGQFYLIVLVGIIISKFTSHSETGE